MAERFPLVVNPNTRKIEEIKETDSLELTGNGISISGSTGTIQQYLRSTGTGEVEWVDPIVDFATRPEATFGGNITITGTLDVGGDVQLGVDNFDQVTTSGKLGVAAPPSSLTATFSVGIIENTTVDKGASAFKTRPVTGGGESAIYIEEQTGTEGWYVKVNSNANLVFTESNEEATLDVLSLSYAGSTFLRDLTFTGENYNAIWDTSANTLKFLDGARAAFGSGSDLIIQHTNNQSSISESSPNGLEIKSIQVTITPNDSIEKIAEFNASGSVDLYYDNSKKFETTTSGVKITGTLDIEAGEGQTKQLRTDATDLVFNNPFTSGSPTSNVNLFVSRGSSAPSSIRWNEVNNRWQFTNDGVQYYNMLLPEETVSAAADEFGASADPNRYDISSTSIVNVDSNTYLQVQLANIADIQKFTLSHQVKMFGASNTPAANLPSTPAAADVTYTASTESGVFDDPEIPHSFYVYAIAAYRLDNGDISSSEVGATYIENISSPEMNEANYNSISINRTSVTGVALYRGEFTTAALAQDAIANFSNPTNPSANLFKLIQVLGTKEFPSGSLTTQYIDYGTYDVPLWIDNTERNPDGTYAESVHFPLTPPLTPKRGWVVGSVRDINGINGTFRIDVAGVQASDPADHALYLYHDDTLNIQEAIDTTAFAGRNYLIIPGGTYLIDHLKLPSGFTLSGLNDATVFKKQYWTTTNINNLTYEGMKNAMFFSENFDFEQLSNTWVIRDFTMRDLVIDGNGAYQILYDASSLGAETNNCCIGFPNSDFVRLISIKVRNTSGPALFAEGSINMQITATTFLNGMQTERYGTPCILMSDCENTTIGTSFFRNFPGALDFTTGQILAMSGCVIRNCGAGIQIYGSVNTDVLNNIILGPVDEFIPVPDLYDSDYDGVNISVFPGNERVTPVYQYQTEGNNVDLSDTILKFNVYNATVSGGVETVDILNPRTDVQFQYFIPVENTIPLDDVTLGQIRFKISAESSANIPIPTVNSYLVYSISGINYYDIGSDVEFVLDTGVVDGEGSNTTYLLTVTNQAAFDALIVDDYIKLASHDYAPDISVNVWRILSKVVGTENKLQLQAYQEDPEGNLSISNSPALTTVGTATVGGGFIQVRQTFTIAKGVISIVQ